MVYNKDPEPSAQKRKQILTILGHIFKQELTHKSRVARDITVNTQYINIIYRGVMIDLLRSTDR